MSKIEYEFRSDKYAIYAIHGGNIDLGTSMITKNIAEEDLSFYIYNGKDYSDYIKSRGFEEPEAVSLSKKVETIISIHGEKTDDKEFIMIGGMDEILSEKIAKSLSDAGFKIENPPEHLNGKDPKNICNKGKSKKGVQLEISRKLRHSIWENKDLLNKFTIAVREAILK